jgi:hypothetical protein
MLEGARLFVVVPACNEERLLAATLASRSTIGSFGCRLPELRSAARRVWRAPG